MHIEWNRVTRASQIAAIILALLIFGMGFWLGTQFPEADESREHQTSPTDAGANGGMISDASYQCDGNRQIHALFYDDKVTLQLSDGRTYNLPHVISGSGVRYASEDESYVFWEKGQNATFTEPTEDGTSEDVACVSAPIPE